MDEIADALLLAARWMDWPEFASIAAAKYDFACCKPTIPGSGAFDHAVDGYSQA
jgi:hypothetical protein